MNRMSQSQANNQASSSATLRDEDVVMQDVDGAARELETDKAEAEAAHRTGLDIKDQRIRILPGATTDSASFEIKGEDHTLGNALKWIITKNPDVEFCGYSIPHPAEPKMNIRIQMLEGTALDALEKGLTDLEDLCGVVLEKFEAAREEFPKPPTKIIESMT